MLESIVWYENVIRWGVFFLILILLYLLMRINKIKEIKNRLPYWLKGGVTLLVLFILSYMILKPSPYLPLVLSPLTLVFKELHLLKDNVFLKVLILFMDHFVVGAIVGFVYGKIKFKDR